MRTIKDVIQAVVLGSDETVKSVHSGGALSGATEWATPLNRGDKLQLRALVKDTIALAVRVGARIGLCELSMRDFFDDAVSNEAERIKVSGGTLSEYDEEITADPGAAAEIDVTDANKS